MIKPQARSFGATSVALLLMTAAAISNEPVSGQTLTPPGVATTPMAAANAYLVALNANQRGQYVETMAFPFVHIQPNGDKILLSTPNDLSIPNDRSFSRTEFRDIEILATSGDLVVYSIRFQRYDDNGDPSLLVHALWGVNRVDEGWKVGWSQFLGPV